MSSGSCSEEWALILVGVVIQNFAGLHAWMSVVVESGVCAWMLVVVVWSGLKLGAVMWCEVGSEVFFDDAGSAQWDWMLIGTLFVVESEVELIRFLVVSGVWSGMLLVFGFEMWA